MQEGKKRVQRSVELLQEVAGPCYPMLFLKMDSKEWEPVGEEDLYSIVLGKNGTAALVICDSDGNSKTMSAWVPSAEAGSFSRSLASRGIQKFEGDVRLPI